MNQEHDREREPSWCGLPEEEAVARLVAEAGPRPQLPRADLDAIRRAARSTWAARYRRRPVGISRLPWRLAVAAAVGVVALGLAWWMLRSGAVEPVIVATVLRGDRGSTLRVGADAWRPVVGGLAVPAGATLVTGSAGGATLALGAKGSLRLDAATTVELAAADLLVLRSGALYLDDGGVGGPGLAIDTAVGTFRDVGTQFELRVVAGPGATPEAGVRLRVREGRVALERGAGTVDAGAGEELAVEADGTVVRGRLPSYGPAWDWVVAAAPAFEVDGVLLGDFLAWAAREGGWQLELADEPGRERAASVVLHGSIAGLALDDALGVMLASCGLGHRLEDGVLVVSSKG